MTPRIIFIHGMFLTPKSWEYWLAYFDSLAYEVEAPTWPLHDGEPAALREHIPPGLGKLGLADLIERYRGLLLNEAEPPVLIGHSLGGLICQRLAAEDLASAAVCITSVAPNRMLALDWSFMRNTASITNPFAGDKPFEMTPERFRKNFANTMSEEDPLATWKAYAVHESRQVLRDITGDQGEIDLSAPHVPLLFIGAEKDEIIPPSLNRRNASAYEDKRSHSEFIEFSGRGHFICGEPGWKEVVDTVADWLDAHLAAPRS